MFNALCKDQSGCVLPGGIDFAPGRESAETYLARKVKFNGLDADVLWSRRHGYVCSGRLGFEKLRSMGNSIDFVKSQIRSRD